MAVSIKATKQAFELLENYVGDNPYIKMIKQGVLIKKNQDFSNFEIDYVIKNHDFNPIVIDKICKVCDWFGDKKQKDWNYQHKITKLQITYLLGETESNYHCYVNYKRNQEKPVMCFIPKRALLDELFDITETYKEEEIDFEQYDEILKPHGIKLLNIQKETALFALNRPKCIIANCPGTAKTLSVIVAANIAKFKKILVLCPASLLTNWRNEIIRLEPNVNDISIIESADSKNKSELEEFLGYESGKSNLKVGELRELAKESGKWVTGNKYTIVNYDIIDEFHKIPKTTNAYGKSVKSRKKDDIENYLKNSELLNSNFDLIILDEAHVLSNYKSTRSETIEDYIKKSEIKNCWLLSGTPVNNKLDGYYQILKLIDHRVTKDQEYFMNYYCNSMKIPAKGEKERLTNMFLKYKNKNTWFDLTQSQKDELKTYITNNARKITVMGEPDESKLLELQYITKDYYLRKTKEDIDNIPEKVIYEKVYDMTPEEWVNYDKLWSDYETKQIDELGRKEEDLNQILTEQMLQRGFIADQMVSRTIEFANTFLEKGMKVFLITTYTSELMALYDYYGKDRAVIFKGGISTKNRDIAVAKFNDPNSGVDVFIGNIIASNVGISLHKNCKTAIFCSFSHSYAKISQSLDRIHRVGSREEVSIYFQMFKNTISEDVWNVVIKKELMTNSLIKKESEK